LADDDRGSGNRDNLRRLVIVESPTKARKIAGYLGANYIVESSRGHIRDLPKNAADVPAKYKSEPWARTGVDVDHDFEPLYVISPDKKATVTELKSLLKDVDELYLATDGDREGEAIAWHLLETLKPKIPVRRMVFHEITESAIRAAAADPRELDTDLVDAQETRRILDRLYGYEVSPVLWKKVAPRLSAGRVQSVALRIVCDRENEIELFRPQEYWNIAAELRAPDGTAFETRLHALDGETLKKFTLGNKGDADRALEIVKVGGYSVASVEAKPVKRNPPPLLSAASGGAFAAPCVRGRALRTYLDFEKPVAEIEAKIEEHLVKSVEAAGGLVRKLKWIGRRGAADRLVVWPWVPEKAHHAIHFVELKAPGKEPKDLQAREIARLRAMGCAVFVLDSIEAVDAYVKGRS
jgi:hypothetical protein